MPAARRPAQAEEEAQENVSRNISGWAYFEKEKEY